MNNNLIIFYHDGSKDVYSFPVGTGESAVLDHFKSMRPDVQGEDIKKYFFIEEDEIPSETYGRFYELSENLKLTMNLREYMISEKTRQIKLARNAFLSRLDLPFMMSLEEEDDVVKNHIIKLKSFLRGIPSNLRFSEIQEDSKILLYSPFGNIFDIALVNQGDGYTVPPEITFEAPKIEVGFPAKAKAFVKGGKVTRLEITDHGSGYDHAPKITIAPPTEGIQAVAFAGPPQNTNLSHEEIFENTGKVYLDS